jgi:hypothetical protein
MSADDLWTAPAVKARAVTPSNTTIVNARAIWVGGVGVVRGELLDDNDGTTCDFTVPAGTFLSVSFKRIYSTGTTATLILALY